MIHRICNIPILTSFFLFGPRQTGKTTLINQFLKDKNHWSIDLLERSTYMRYLVSPEQFYKEALHNIRNNNPDYIFIDEIQKIPSLLDEVQRLMQNTNKVFILTGSSARKLKRSNANLLGGRATERHIYPLCINELGNDINLSDILHYGTLPSIALEPSIDKRIDLLNAYVSIYLTEEIQQESLVRNLPGFVNFLEIAAQQSGELLNYSNIARDIGLQARTVQTYYDILSDTLIGLKLPAYNRSARKRLRNTPKYYLFDIGIINALERQLRSEPDVNRFGKLFEHFIILESDRLAHYLSPDARLYFWHTLDDKEVDLLIENKGKIIAAIEIKSSTKVSLNYLSGLKAFASYYPDVPRYVVARVPESYSENGITILTWQQYLDQLCEWLKE